MSELYTAIHPASSVNVAVKRKPLSRVSRGGLDEINPEDVIHGEYSNDHGENYGEYIDLVYLDGDILRTFSGAVPSGHPILEELKVLLRDDKKFYLVPIKEVSAGFAFKRTDIVRITVSSLIQGNDNHLPSCIWTVNFKDESVRTLETQYQSYFAYGATTRPRSMTNVDVLEKVFPTK